MNSSLFDKLAAEEDAFFESTFLSPVLKGRKIRVRIAGIIVELKVSRPKDFEGWGVFKPLSFKEARKVRDPDMTEREHYLRLFPCLRLILCRHSDDQWYGIPANVDSRFKITGYIPIHFAEEVQMFDVVKARFDGQIFWFQNIDETYNPAIAPYLRESLATLLEPDKIQLACLSTQDKEAYNLAFWPAFEADLESKRDRKEEQLKAAIERAGGVYRSYIERGATYTVEYQVDGHTHRSVVDKDTLSVQSAGICLSGRDRDFDLQSLVHVIRRGHNRRVIVNTEGRMYNEYGYQEGGMFHGHDDEDDW